MTQSFAIDDSAVVWSAPSDELGARPLVLLMHGRGSHENDLAGLIPLLPQEFGYASLRAPLPFDGGGYTWFAAGAPGAPPAASVDAAVAAVLEWLDRVAPSGPVAAAGFSQGGAMATHLMRHAPERFVSYVNLAGFIVPGEAPADERLSQLRPPVFWGRDGADPVIPQSAIDRTKQWLPLRSRLTSRSYPGIGHSISPAEASDVSSFLVETLRD
ncbi:MAG: alpha/beta hydrolase-fold protein [Homoserinimonas sp.]